MNVPLPPEHLHEIGFQIEPALEVAAWLKSTFVFEGAPYHNPDHLHLVKADIVCMWTNVEFVDGGMPVVGMAEIVTVTGKPWAKAEKVDHLCMLHGSVPQGRIWLYAPFWAACNDWTAMATGEHELYHYAQKHTRDGEPMFDDEERPILTKRAHDVGEFVGIMKRYGPDACGGKSKEFVEAALRPPTIAPVSFKPTMCATCRV